MVGSSPIGAQSTELISCAITLRRFLKRSSSSAERVRTVVPDAIAAPMMPDETLSWTVSTSSVE